MKIYLAAPYHAQRHMRWVRDELAGLGHVVTCGWIDQEAGEVTAERLRDDPSWCARFAKADLDEIAAADAVVSFTAGGGGRGGRHFELGVALALRKRLLLVGEREHVFHCLPQVLRVPDWDALRAALTGEEGTDGN